MLNDAAKERKLLSTLRLTAKVGQKIVFEQDLENPEDLILSVGDVMKLNTTFLYRSKKKLLDKQEVPVQ